MKPQAPASRSGELKRTFKLAVPLILTNLGQYAFQAVDVFVGGRAGAEVLAGVAAGSAFLVTFLIMGMGILVGMDTRVSQATGAGKPEIAKKVLSQGLWLAGIFSLALVPLVLAAGRYYYLIGAAPEVVDSVIPYVNLAAWSLPGALFFTAFQRYWQAREVVRPFLWFVLAANLLNLALDLAFTTGWGGLPQMGSRGIAVATLGSRSFLALCGLAYTLLRLGRGRLARSFEWDRFKDLLLLGLPASAQLTLEFLAFTLTTTLSGKLGAGIVAAHQIVLTIASVTFMFPLGISAATAVRVGTLTGAGRRDAARRAGWIGICMGTGVMCLSAAVMLSFPDVLLGLFTHEPHVLEQGSAILFLAALFQIFDGLQVSGTGALRGYGDTRTPMLANFIGHYPIGVAIGVTLAFNYGWGLRGLWTGLAAGLFSVSLIIIYGWMSRGQKR